MGSVRRLGTLSRGEQWKLGGRESSHTDRVSLRSPPRHGEPAGLLRVPFAVGCSKFSNKASGACEQDAVWEWRLFMAVFGF